MSVVKIWYRPDKVNDFKPHSDGTGSFSSFLISRQLAKPVNRAAFDVLAVAKVGPHEFDSTGEYVNGFKVDKDETIMFKAKGQPRHPRIVAVVSNDSDHAVPIEFGSGKPSVGKSKGKGRPQGGSNRAYRVLGRAGGKIGDWHE